MAGLRNQPENKKQSHHGGDKIGVSHFPGTTMMSATMAFNFFNPTTRFLLRIRHATYLGLISRS